MAAPNLLDAQTPATVSRTLSDMRALATGIEAFRVDHNLYPIGSDNPSRVPQAVVDTVTQIAGGYDYYTFSTRNNTFGGISFDHVGQVVDGHIWHGITTPVPYITTAPQDPFIAGAIVTYAYRESRDGSSGTQWIVTSVGPDADIGFNWRGATSAKQETAPPNSFTGSVAAAFDAAAAELTPKEGRHGDISERAIEPDADGYTLGDLREALQLITYDPTNGTISDGDLWRLGPGSGTSGR